MDPRDPFLKNSILQAHRVQNTKTNMSNRDSIRLCIQNYFDTCNSCWGTHGA